jgi:predicted site-specific integrase-resolvase
VAPREQILQYLSQFEGRSLSVNQAREALCVSRRTIYYWMKRGRVRTVRTSMGSRRVLVDSLPTMWLERL